MLKTKPRVFAIKNRYEITVLVTEPSIMWVKIGDKCYYDEVNGIMRSAKPVHKICVPMSELDKAGEYTVYERAVIDRPPYFPKVSEESSHTYKFYPVKSESARAYLVADTHGNADEPVKAAKAYGDIDFLVLNGDIQDDSSKLENFNTIFEIAARLTNGEKPVVFSRGNHDMRGACAELFPDYTPTDNGNTYYTFRLGSIWGMVLDSGEDKDDSYKEYGHLVCCHGFRERQIEFIKSVIKNADGEYNHPDVNTKIVIAHNPFTEKIGDPFNIEEDIYREWASLLKENVKPHAMLCGHMHERYVSSPNDEHDHLGHPSPVVVSSVLDRENNYYGGCGVEFGNDSVTVTFTDSDEEITEKIEIKK